MGLTIHYQLAATGDEANARKFVQQLRQAALDLPLHGVWSGWPLLWALRPPLTRAVHFEGLTEFA
jgi:hypothetical protein